jgi:hypothetical protein
MDVKEIRIDVEALREAKTHLDKAQFLRKLIVAAENLVGT